MNTHLTRPVPVSRSCRPASLLACWLSILLVCGFHAWLPAARAASSPPDFMTYQGFLVDGNGNPLATNAPANYPVIFRIYSASTGTAGRLWSEQQIVTVDKGNFSVVLGEGTVVGGEAKPALSSIFAGATASDRYISISVTIGGSTPEILPRLRLLPSPYSFLATSAANIVQPNGSAVLSYANNRLEVTGNFFGSGTFSGNGSGLTDLNASQLTAGALPDARLSGNVARRDTVNTFTGNQTINNALGVGTAPGARLDVLSSTGSRLRVFDFGGGSGSQLVGGWAANSPLGPQVRYERVGAPGFWDQGMVNDYFVIEESDIPRLTLRNGGNMGLGTTTPNATLSLGDSLANTKLALWDGGVGSMYGFGVQPGQFRIHLNNASDRFTFLNGVAGTELVNLYGNGVMRVGISGSQLNVNHGGFSDSTVTITPRGGDTYGLVLTGGGALKPGGGSWGGFSDKRLKTVLGDFKAGLNELNRLNAVRYRYHDDPVRGLDSKTEHFGFVAQDVQAVLPQAVSSMSDGMLILNPDLIYLTSINAIKELHTQLKAIQTENAALKQRLAESASKELARDGRLAALEEQIKKLAHAGAADRGADGPADQRAGKSDDSTLGSDR